MKAWGRQHEARGVIKMASPVLQSFDLTISVGMLTDGNAVNLVQIHQSR